eukprot:5594200-Lingulodinium_polyedra.AAC.1
MAAATEGWSSEACHQRHHSLHFRLGLKDMPLQWVGQRRAISDYITNVTGVAATNVDARDAF